MFVCFTILVFLTGKAHLTNTLLACVKYFSTLLTKYLESTKSGTQGGTYAKSQLHSVGSSSSGSSQSGGKQASHTEFVSSSDYVLMLKLAC